MTNSDSIYYQTKADGNAFYAVSPRNLPILPYYIEIVPTNVLPTRAGVPSTGVPSSAVSPAISAAVLSPVPSTTTATGGGVASKISIPTYAKQNKEYHSAQDIDIMAATKHGKPVDPASVASASDAVFGSAARDIDQNESNSPRNGSSDAPQAQATAQRSYMTLLLAVTLLIFLGSGAVVFMRKRAQDDPNSPSSGVYTREESVDKPKDE